MEKWRKWKKENGKHEKIEKSSTWKKWKNEEIGKMEKKEKDEKMEQDQKHFKKEKCFSMKEHRKTNTNEKKSEQTNRVRSPNVTKRYQKCEGPLHKTYSEKSYRIWGPQKNRFWVPDKKKKREKKEKKVFFRDKRNERYEANQTHTQDLTRMDATETKKTNKQDAQSEH